MIDVSEFELKASEASMLLRTLANQSRLMTLCQLVHGEKSVNELEKLVGLRQSALSQHLAILRRERLVKTRREAQFVYYSLASAEVEAIMQALYEIYCAPNKAAGLC